MGDPLDVAAQAYEALQRHGEALGRVSRAAPAELREAVEGACAAFAALEQDVLGLSWHYVALLRLHGAADRADVLAAVQEIVVNIVGSEELVVFERRGDALVPVHAFGVAPPAGEVPLGGGSIGAAAASGAAWFREPPAPHDALEGTLSGCVPLRDGEEVVGAVAFYRLLPHKPALTEGDRAVLDLLSAHGGRALRHAAASGGVR